MCSKSFDFTTVTSIPEPDGSVLAACQDVFCRPFCITSNVDGSLMSIENDMNRLRWWLRGSHKTRSRLRTCDHECTKSEDLTRLSFTPDMSKRALSPNLLPPAKRLHTTGSHRATTRAPFSFNDSLYDELVLSIFSHLSWVDLCSAQATSTHWCRLASDNTLWKNLFIKVFGRSRLRGSRGYAIRSDGREVRPLPGRIHSKPDPVMDWKWMFRISSNWKRGMRRRHFDL